jgi:protein SCO1/2
VTDFRLVERDGTPVTLTDLKDKVWIANFIFTSCKGPCPLMSGHMKTLQHHFADKPNIRFVSITSDPATDTPAVLAEYANRFSADGKRWLFLTGELNEIKRVARDAFKLPAGDDPGMHSTRFVLVDPQGQIRGWLDSQAPDFQPKIQAAARQLASDKNVSH